MFILLLLLPAASPFLFGSQGDDFCYQMDLENCFRDVFLSSDRLTRDVPFFQHFNISELDRRKAGVRHLLLCHKMRRFSHCFMYPGCTDNLAAEVASTQYHMVFGRQLPKYTFLAYRGFGKQICDRSCSREAMAACRRTMSESEKTEEQALLVDAAQSVARIGQTDDVVHICDKFKHALLQVMRFRSEYCGEAAKCTCMDAEMQKGITFCNAGCEHLLRGENSSSSSTSFVILFLVLYLLLYP